MHTGLRGAMRECSAGKSWGTSRRRAEIDTAVATALRLAADPANSLRDVLAPLCSAGLGRPLALSTLQRVLTNLFYTGLVRSTLPTKTTEAQHEPLLSKEVFLKVQRSLRKRRCW